MSMRFALEQLNPRMREQARRKMLELQDRHASRTMVVPGADDAKVVNWKVAPRKLRSAPLLPQFRKRPDLRLAFYLRADGFPEFELEHKFHPDRKWRVDIAYVGDKLAIEIEGVTPGNGGRHQRIAGFRGDIKKYNELTLAGWRLLRFMPEMVSSGYAVNVTRRVLEALRGGGESARNAEEESRAGSTERRHTGSSRAAPALQARVTRAAHGAR